MPDFKRFSTALAVVLVVLATSIIYMPVFHIGFLSDDYLDLEHGFGPETFARFEAGGFRPLIVAVWAFDAAVYGPQRAWGWHLTNLLLHFLCLCALLLLADSLGMSARGKLTAAAVFLLSAAAIPSVARVSGRTTIIAMLPLLLALRMHAIWERSARENTLSLLLGQLLFLTSLLAKETALLAPFTFGAITLYLSENHYKILRRTIQAFVIYLIPVFIYSIWRYAAVGMALGYKESATLGFFMLRNSIELIGMNFSPWLDSVPARTLLLLMMAISLTLYRRWKALFLGAMLTFPLLLTVSNLPPHTYYAYAALPGIALCLGFAAKRLRNWRATAMLVVFVTGTALEARDEIGRMLAASEYTESVKDLIVELAETHPGMIMAIEGIREGVGGYGTLWPGAYREALLTRGIQVERPPVERTRFTESMWQAIQDGELPTVVFADLDRRPAVLDTFHTETRQWANSAMDGDTVLAIGADNRVTLSSKLWLYNSCDVISRGDSVSLMFLDRSGELREVMPYSVDGIRYTFDLEGNADYLTLNLPAEILIHGDYGSTEIVFSRQRVYLEALRARLESKNIYSN